jgi:hypothetical protein
MRITPRMIAQIKGNSFNLPQDPVIRVARSLQTTFDVKKALRISSKCLISLRQKWWAMQVSNLRPPQCEDYGSLPISPFKSITYQLTKASE